MRRKGYDWINAVTVVGALCGVLAGGFTDSAFGGKDGHVQEVIKDTKEGITHEKEAIKRLEKSIKSSEDAHAKEALKHAEE